MRLETQELLVCVWGGSDSQYLEETVPLLRMNLTFTEEQK
jgi:hypothetical protein